MDWEGLHEKKSKPTLKFARINALEPFIVVRSKRRVKGHVVILEICEERGVHRIAEMKRHFYCSLGFDRCLVKFLFGHELNSFCGKVKIWFRSLKIQMGWLNSNHRARVVVSLSLEQVLF